MKFRCHYPIVGFCEIQDGDARLKEEEDVCVCVGGGYCDPGNFGNH